MEKDKSKNIYGKPEISDSLSIAVTSSQWLGALIFYLIKFGKVPFRVLWSKKYASRNLWTGYIAKIILLIISIYFIWIYFLKDTIIQQTT